MPGMAAQVSSAAVEHMSLHFADESDAWHATLDAWVDGYMRDYVEQRVVARKARERRRAIQNVANGGVVQTNSDA